MVAEHADHIHQASSHTARPHADCLDLASLVRGTLCAALFRGPVRHVRASEPIFEAGEPADHLILIRSGLIKQMTVSRDGDELTVDIFGADDVFGEMCFRDHSHRYWATAIEPSEIVTLARKEFLDALSRRPDLLHQFLHLLAGRLSAAYAEIESRVFQSVVERLGRRLLQLAEMAHGSDWITLPQSFRHGELARLLGVRHESVTRAIQELPQARHHRIDTPRVASYPQGAAEAMGVRFERPSPPHSAHRRGRASPPAIDPVIQVTDVDLCG